MGAATRIQVENLNDGYRFREIRESGLTSGKLFGVSFGLMWVIFGIGILFLSETAMPGASIFLKTTIATVLVGLGLFIIWAIQRDFANVLEVDTAKRTLHHFTIDKHNKQRGHRVIAFNDVSGVFTDNELDSESYLNRVESLVIKYKGRPGRLIALNSSSDDLSVLRDMLVTKVLNMEVAPAVDDLTSLAARTRWEIQQRGGFGRRA